jgi:hypothetical protein
MFSWYKTHFVKQNTDCIWNIVLPISVETYNGSMFEAYDWFLRPNGSLEDLYHQVDVIINQFSTG